MAPKGPIKITPDFIMPAPMEGKPNVLALETGGRGVLIPIDPKTASDLATAALLSLTLPQTPRGERPASEAPPTVVIEPHIQVTATGWLDPEKAEIQPGHSVLLLEVAGARLLFSAPTEAWRGALEQLSAQGSRQSSN